MVNTDSIENNFHASPVPIVALKFGCRQIQLGWEKHSMQNLQCIQQVIEVEGNYDYVPLNYMNRG